MMPMCRILSLRHDKRKWPMKSQDFIHRINEITGFLFLSRSDKIRYIGIISDISGTIYDRILIFSAFKILLTVCFKNIKKINFDRKKNHKFARLDFWELQKNHILSHQNFDILTKNQKILLIHR
jgi:hypothetical protein